jgi:ABC-type multidrug transport system fused ATPase/permease subunit
MNKWTIEKIQEFYTCLNEYFGLSVNPEIEIGEKNRFPVHWNDGKILFIPTFFNDEDIDDDVRTNLLLIMYSGFYHTKYNDNHIGVHPMFMVKGICDELGFRFLSDSEIENNLRSVRRKLYQDENAFFFKVGYDLRESAWMRYEVTKIERNEDDVLVTVKPIGYHLGEPEKVFTEEDLYNRTCTYDSIDEVKVDMRKNLVVISGPSGVGKTTVVKEVMKQYPELNKTVSVTTRTPRSEEADGKDYYFISTEEFYDY